MTRRFALYTLILFSVLSAYGVPVVLKAAVPTAETAPLTWDFESSADGFWALAHGVSVTRVRDRSPGGRGMVLRVSGPLATVTVAAVSGDIPMSPRQFYRLSARVKIESAAPGTPLPSAGCVFSTAGPGTFLGRALLDSRESPFTGTWRRLTVEFRVPLGATRGRIAVGSCTGSSIPGASNGKSSIIIDDIRLEPIEHYTIEGKYRLDPVPPGLERMRGIHPRIYLTTERIAELRKAIVSTHAALWADVRAQADRLAGQNPPEYMDESKFKNIEQLYMRPVGEAMPYLAIAYVLTGERRYLDAAVKWARASCSYPTWGLREFEGSDLSTGHQLYGLALLYDWCYADLPDDVRRMIRDTLTKRASALFTAAAEGIIVKDDAAWRLHPWAEWDEAWLQNHLWINSCALALAGIALFDEDAEALRWTAFALDRYRTAMSFFGSDGSSHEGPGYWSYGVEYLLKFMDVARDLLGVDFFDSGWWRNTASYRQYMALPRNSWTYSNTTVDYGDSPRYDWYGSDYMLRRLAGEYRDGRAQWLAGAIDGANAEHPVSRWLNILWYDPSVKPIPPDDLPTLRRFEDIDIVTARSDWSGNESFVFFKCGPYIGEKALREMTYCPSSAHHVHPDAGGFTLFGAGEWLIRDDGYRAKITGQHNTLLVVDTPKHALHALGTPNGGEQLGGGRPIFDGVEPHAVQARPRILKAVSEPGLDVMSGDVTEAYPKASGLRRFVRHLLFLKPDVLIVADDIALDRPRDLELRFHPEQGRSDRDGAAFTMRGKRAVLRLDILTPDHVSASAESLVTLPKEPEDPPGSIYTIRLRTNAPRWRSIVALSWAGQGTEPPRVTMSGRGDISSFIVGDRKIAFDWKTGAATLKR